MSEFQPELFGVPTATRDDPGWCRVALRFGAPRPCGRAAGGLAAEWTAPLDPAQRMGSCQDCADAYGLDFAPF